MSYQSQWQLTYDDPFVSRCRACITQRAVIYKDDERPDFVALADSLLRQDNGSEFVTFQTMLANAPGFADTVDAGDGTIDSTKIEDAEIQSAVDADFPIVAGLYYAADGTPKTTQEVPPT
jgi:hypothetical protein